MHRSCPVSICLSVCLSVTKMQKTRFSQKLSNLEELWCLLTTYKKLCKLNWAFQRTHYWIHTMIIIIIIIIITKTMLMVLSSWQSHCESSPGSFDERKTAPSGRRPKTKPVDLGCVSACTGCQKLHRPSPFIIITQPES